MAKRYPYLWRDKPKPGVENIRDSGTAFASDAANKVAAAVASAASKAKRSKVRKVPRASPATSSRRASDT